MKSISSHIVVVLFAVLALCGCQGGGGGGSGGSLDGSGGDDGGCVEPPVQPITANPNFRNVTTGIASPPSTPWQSIARGHIDDVASSTACCEDYVLGSDVSLKLTVIYGGALKGLTAFADQPTITFTAAMVGSGVADVALADLDGDDRNDLIALLVDGTITVRMGQANSPFFEDTLSTYSSTVGTATGRDQLVVADIDCDSSLDILIPSDEGIIVVLNDGSGGLTATNILPSPVALDWVAVGDLDHDDDADVVASASDGIAQVWIGDCGAFEDPDLYGKSQGTGTYEATRIALGTLCPSYISSFDLVFSYGDTIDLYCGNGSGDFSNVQEAHGTESPTGADFRWTQQPTYAARRYADLAITGTGSTQQIVALDINGNDIMALTPSTCRYESLLFPITLPFPSQIPNSFTRLIPTSNPAVPTSWERLSLVGGAGLQVIR